MPKSIITPDTKKRDIQARHQIFAGPSKDPIEGRRPLSDTIKNSPQDVYALLKNIKNFPLFLENLEKVETLSESQAEWTFKNPTSSNFMIPMSVKYSDARDGLVWKSQDGLGFDYHLAIQLEPAQAGRGTIVRVKASYDSTAGDIMGTLEKLFGKDADVMAKKTLQRFKAFCETGHVPTIEGQSSGRDEDQSPTIKH